MIGAMEAPKRLQAARVVLGSDLKGHMESIGDGDNEREREPILTKDGEVWKPELHRRINVQGRYGMLSSRDRVGTKPRRGS